MSLLSFLPQAKQFYFFSSIFARATFFQCDLTSEGVKDLFFSDLENPTHQCRVNLTLSSTSCIYCLKPRHPQVDTIRNQGGCQSIPSKSRLRLFPSVFADGESSRFSCEECFCLLLTFPKMSDSKRKLILAPAFTSSSLSVILVVCQFCPFVPLIAGDIFILSKLHQAHCKMNQFGKSMSCTVVLSVH